MNKYLILFFIVITIPLYSSSNIIYRNYVQCNGEGPIGQHMKDFETIIYTREAALKLAKNEVNEFLSGMVYGYKYVYKVENKITSSDGYFELTPIAKINPKDPNITLNQIESDTLSIKMEALYRLNEDQKNYISGFQSMIAQMSSGSSNESWIATWENRINVYKNALRNAVLNGAKKDTKSRPLYIRGKLLLADTPHFSLNAGEWRVVVKIHLVISEVSYNDVY